MLIRKIVGCINLWAAIFKGKIKFCFSLHIHFQLFYTYCLPVRWSTAVVQPGKSKLESIILWVVRETSPNFYLGFVD